MFMIQIIPLYLFIRWNWIWIIITALVAFVGISMASQAIMNLFNMVCLLFNILDPVHLISLIYLCLASYSANHIWIAISIPLSLATSREPVD